MRILLPILIAAAAAPAALASPPTWAPPAVVVVTLRPAAAVRGAQAVVRDVATLDGGSLADRQRIAALDLVDTPAGPQEAVVSRGQVVYRLLLAGLEERRFRVEGAESVRVSRGTSPAITPVSAVAAAPAAPRLLHQGLVGGKAEPVLIKCRDGVRLVTHIGELEVVVAGEALEDGRAGQVVRVRNVDSGRMIRGRVVDRTTVEVDFVRSQP